MNSDEIRGRARAIVTAAKLRDQMSTYDGLVRRLREWATDDLRETARDGTVEPRDIEVWALMMEEAADAIEALEAENKGLREVAKEAHNLLVWTHQGHINVDEMPTRGYWLVTDLHPSVYNLINEGERVLWGALLRARAALEGVTQAPGSEPR